MKYDAFTTKFDREVDISDYAETFKTRYDMGTVEKMLAASGGDQVVDIPGQDPVVILLDCSGSMRGGSIISAIAGLRATGNAFERAGRPFEILGFTTGSWQGGKSREAWIRTGMPAMPGRLNDLLHINIKRFDEDWSQASKNMVGLLSVDLLKENIDGEALLWAHERAQAVYPDAKMLVISDGRPHDDSTILANHANYLQSHLNDTISELSSRGAAIAAVTLSYKDEPRTTKWPESVSVPRQNNTIHPPTGIIDGIGRCMALLAPDAKPFKATQAPLTRFIVGVRGTVEDSDFIIDAPDAESAAMIYLEKSLSEKEDGISVDVEEVFEIGKVDCRAISAPQSTGRPGVIDWEDIDHDVFEISALMPDYAQRAGLTEDDTPEM